MRYTLQRAGVSLLEVLIAIGVVAVGLLGVAAVIPLATFQMIEASKADRAAACGQAVLEDLNVRGILRPGSWRDALNAGILVEEPYLGAPPRYVGDHGMEFGESFAVDPLYLSQIAKAIDRVPASDFPYRPEAPGIPLLPPPVPLPDGSNYPRTWTRMQRVTWSGVGLNPALSRAVFMWRDDLEIPIPDDTSLRPEQLYLRSGVTPLKAQNRGHYSWMVTVTPSAEHVDFATPNRVCWSHPENSPLYTVSVVVFYRRNFAIPAAYFDPQAGGERDAPGERQVALRFLGAGLGGGEVELMLIPNPAGQDPTIEYLDIKENDWLMVSGGFVRQCYYKDLTGAYASGLVPVGVHKWYRVVAASETVVEDRDGDGSLGANELDFNGNGIADPPYRQATLAGPDWNPAWSNDWTGDGVPDHLATLMEGVIGVYSTTIELEM